MANLFGRARRSVLSGRPLGVDFGPPPPILR
jgi:hypothetical protein